MFKRFVALISVVVLCVSLFMPVALMDGCLHSSKSPITIYEYENYSTTHHQKNAYSGYVCNLCGAKFKSGEEPTYSFERHVSYDNKLYDYHSGQYHYFYKICRYCNGWFEQEKLICPGGNNHVNPND